MILKRTEFVPAPEGVHNAVCVDFVDLGIVNGQFGPKAMVKIVWEVEALMKDGRPFTVQKRYSASLHERSSLSQDLKGWRGKPFTADEAKAFDTEKLIGQPCQLVVTHNEHEGSVYANVDNVLKAGDKRLQPSGKYVRQKDRPTDQQDRKAAGPANRVANYNPAATAEEIPF